MILFQFKVQNGKFATVEVVEVKYADSLDEKIKLQLFEALEAAIARIIRIVIASSLQVVKHCLSLTTSLMAYHNSDGLSQVVVTSSS